MNAQRMSTTPDMKPIRAGAQEFREPLRVLRVDKVCRPIHPHLAGHLFQISALQGASFLARVLARDRGRARTCTPASEAPRASGPGRKGSFVEGFFGTGGIVPLLVNSRRG